ncbi:MAG: hypothetical protein LLG01_12590 [Planctomycetaceae bacterium]|nr:hypothetical protein [Planctomycetaceae bacterium]
MTLSRMIVLTGLAATLASGCTSNSGSGDIAKNAADQLVLSYAVDRAADKFKVEALKGKKIFLNCTYLRTGNAEYIQLAFRNSIAMQGGVLVAKEEDADYTVEMASGAGGVEQHTRLLGAPSLNVPGTSVATPEMAVFKNVNQSAILKLLVLVHQKGKFVASVNYYANALRGEKNVLVWSFKSGEEIKQGQERIDRKTLESGAADAATTKPGKKS